MSWRTADSELTLQAACDAYREAFNDHFAIAGGLMPHRSQFEHAVAAACDVAVAAYIEQNEKAT